MRNLPYAINLGFTVSFILGSIILKILPFPCFAFEGDNSAEEPIYLEDDESEPVILDPVTVKELSSGFEWWTRENWIKR